MSDETQLKTRVPLGVKIALFSSLALNLVIIGVVAGAIWSGGPKHMRGAERGGATPFTQVLGADERRVIGREIRSTFQAMKRDDRPRAVRRAAHAEALALLRADAFDQAAFVAVMARQTDVMQVMAQTGAQALARHISGYSAVERANYADRVEDALKSGPRGGPNRSPGPKPQRD